MATINNQEDEFQLQQKTGGAGTIMAGNSGTAGSGAPAAGAPQITGTGFTNLEKYLDANRYSGKDLADNIISQGQSEVNAAQKLADDRTNAFAESGIQAANSAAQNATSAYQAGTAALTKDPWATEGAAAAARGVKYDGPKSAAELTGINTLDENYQNVRNVAAAFGNDFDKQKAGLQKQYGYGSGFASLDTFLGRQDGKDKIQGWAAGVNPGSAQGGIDRVNGAIAAGQQQVTDAQSAYDKAAAEARRARSQPTPAATPAPSVAKPGQISAPASGGISITPMNQPLYPEASRATANPAAGIASQTPVEQEPVPTASAAGTGKGYKNLQKYLK